MENTYKVRLYSDADSGKWNTFVRSSANATFLFDRGFMEYHSNRFVDHSLIASDESGNWVGVMPANVDGNSVTSHAGLTYGGLVHPAKTKLAELLKIFQAILHFLSNNGIEKLSIKTLPPIYDSRGSEGLHYAIFVANGELSRRDALSVLDLSKPVVFSKDRRKCVLRGQNAGLEIREEQDLTAFWNAILIPNMARKHGVKPVHSLDEITLLKSRFPMNIRHFNVYHNNVLVAGTTIFVTDSVAHPQYISANDEKNKLGSLDFLYSELIHNIFSDKRYFDFGISNEQNGRKLNANLIFWKETFGTSIVVQDFYDISTANFKLLDTVLI